MEAKNIQLNICYSCMSSMPEGSSICPACGNDNRVRYNPENTLPEGTVLFRKYLVGKVIGRGGFGVTYIGYDLDLQLKVAIKEYFPAGVSIRTSGSYNVISDISSSQDHSAFSKGCEAFLDEARMLASVNSPYIVHVRDFFREHGTAYIVMDYVNGLTLPKAISRNGGRISAERVVSLMLPLIEQLDKLHEKNIIHRDIKPDNIMLVKDRKGIHPVLLDFGAARSFISTNVSKTYTAVVTPGFAPLEQYSQRSRQGAFTDVYGICATMYYAITGTIPPTATERSAEDIPIRTFRSFGLDVPQHIERAIIHGLALKSAERTQTMQELYAELSGGATVRNSGQSSQTTASRAPAHHAAKRPSSHVQQKAGNTGRAEERTPQKSGGSKIAVILLVLLIVAFAGTTAVYLLSSRNDTPDNTAELQSITEQAEALPDVTDVAEASPDETGVKEAEREQTVASTETPEEKYVFFGSYEQDNDRTNGKERIEWLVLEEKDDRMLLISRYGLDCKKYHNYFQSTSWKECYLRTWLNTTFLDTAFSAEEQKQIRQNEIGDNVFLLSSIEAKQMFSSDVARQCTPTEYAKAEGCLVDQRNGNCWWWLRSEGHNPFKAAKVFGDGSIDGGSSVNYASNTVRPAILVSLNGNNEAQREQVSITAPQTPHSPPTEITLESKSVQIGDYVSFGAYEQDNDLTNGKEPIEWLVLDVQGGKALLLSRYLINTMQYSDLQEKVTWETCSLRTWLNQSFLKDAFSALEQEKIRTTLVTADRNPSKYDINSGNSTQDKVFLLSASEVKKFYYPALSGSQDYKAYFYPSNGDRWSFWWTRTPGYYPNNAVTINFEGITLDRGERVDRSSGVRPAMWVDISALQ